MPEGWAWSKINNIAFVTKLAGFEYSKYIAPTLCEDGIPLFKGKNVQDSKIIYEFESFIPESISNELSRSQITRKCILTPYVGTIGNIGIHDKVGKFHLGSNVGKIELYNSCVILMEEYVVTYLKSSFGYKQLTKHMKATAQASISIEAIRDVYIPIPPENEQQRMWSAILESLTLIENIESYEGDIANMVKLAKTKILDLAIRGKLVPQNLYDEPASVLLERIRAEKEELIKAGKIKRDKKESVIFKGEDNSYYEKLFNGTAKCIDDEIPCVLPQGWEWCRLNTLSDACINSFVDGPFGSNLKTEHYTQNREVRIIQLNNIGEFVWRDIGVKYTTFKHAETLDRCITYPEDIVIAKMMPAGRAIIVPQVESIYVISSDCVRLRTHKQIYNRYLMFAINSNIVNKQIQESVHGIGRSRTSLSKCKELLIPIPPLKEQVCIVDTIETTYRQLAAIAESLN